MANVINSYETVIVVSAKVGEEGNTAVVEKYKKLIGEPLYSIYAARQENPNAYDPWTDEADAELRRMWEEGTSIADIATHFGRKQSAIIVRMKKLGM